MTAAAQNAQRMNEFCDKLQALMVDYRDAWAPDYDVDGDPCQCEGDCPCVPKPNLLPVEWLLITNVMDLDSDRMTVLGIQPLTQRETQTLGLFRFYELQRWL